MNICPREKNIRRKKTNEGDFGETDRLSLDPSYDSIASIKKIIVNFDETVSVRFLAFHTTNKAYCKNYKIDKPDKKICDVCDKDKIQHVHFYFYFLFKNGHQHDVEYKYLVAFLPRSEQSKLSTLTDELYKMAKSLNIEQAYCKIFIYGGWPREPVQSGMSTINLPKELNNAIEGKKNLFMPYKIEGKIDEISTSSEERNIIIYKNQNDPLEQIKVS